MMADTMSPQEVRLDDGSQAGAVRLTPGEMLRKARETRGLGQREVSERLYLTQTYVNCIEHNEWKKLPGDTFIRGYLRSYANLVGLSEAGVVAVYDAMLEEASEGERRRARSRVQSLSDRVGGVMAQRILVGLAVLLLVIGFMLSFPEQEQGAASDGEVTTDSMADGSADAGDTSYEDGRPQSGQVQAPDSVAPDAVVEVQSHKPALQITNAPASDVAMEEVAGAPEAATSGVVQAKPSTVATAETLRIELSAECWTQVKDGTGRVLTSRVHPAGAVLEYQGAAPYSVIIGNAAAAKVLFAGEQVDVAAHTSANVARLKLGN